MNQQWNDIETFVSIAGLFILLAFLVLMAVPIVGFLAQIGAVFAVLYLAYRRHYWLLALGSAGSLISGLFLYGYSLPLVGTWAGVVIPALIWGLQIVSGRKPLTGFMIAGGISVLISLVLFYVEKELIFQAIDEFSSFMVKTIQGSDAKSGTGMVLVEEMMRMFSMMKRLVPSFMALSGVLQLFVGWFGLMIFLGYVGEYFPSMGSFIYWK
ncbi:MAG: hypothetical protein ABIJ45_03290, partial [Candidatus Zixiibacteriota bacterium]